MTAASKKEKLKFLDTLVTIHVGEESNADGLSVIEHQIPYGFSPPLHVHRNEDEIFHVIEGEARFEIGGKDVYVGAGDTLVAPKGVPHSFVVTSSRGARWLNVTSGGDFERMLRASGRPAGHDQIAAVATPPDAAQAATLKAACAAHGIDLIGPPLSLAKVLDHAYA